MIQTLQQILINLTSVFLTLQATLIGMPAGTQLAQVSPTATITLSPSSTSVSVNNTFTVSIVLDTGGQNIYGVDINRLNFDPNILQVVDTDEITPGVQIVPGSLMSLTVANLVDNIGGSIQFSQITTPKLVFSGSGTLATITFRTITPGNSNATFDFILNNTIDANVAGLNNDLLLSVNNGSYVSTSVSTTTTKFIIGDRVYTTSKLKVRSTPSITGKALCTQNKSAYGSIIGGPTVAGGYTWWQINYDTLCDGWSVQDWLSK